MAVSTLSPRAKQKIQNVWEEWAVKGPVIAIVAIIVVMAIATITSGSDALPENITDVPENVSVPIGDYIDDGVDWLSTEWRYQLSRGFSSKVLWFLVRIERLLQWLPWWLVMASAAFATWRLAGRNIALVGLGGMLFIGFIVTNLSYPTKGIVSFYNCRCTAEQGGKVRPELDKTIVPSA